jgi:hypothetical protein
VVLVVAVVTQTPLLVQELLGKVTLVELDLALLLMPVVAVAVQVVLV